MGEFQVRQASADEFSEAVDWAAEEGWNPGLDDLGAFFNADPDGFYMGWLNGEPVASISVVRYGQDFGFLGFYIVHPGHRGSGFGLNIWNAGMAHLKGRTIGLDGVPDQVENYSRSGFVHFGANIRFTGIPDVSDNSRHDKAGISISILMSDGADLASLMAYDRLFFPAQRDKFLSTWLSPLAAPGRETLLAIEDGEIGGYVTCRSCRSGFKIGPLFANNVETAKALLTASWSRLPKGGELSLDVPQDNPAAMHLAREFGLKPSFETARMYRGPAPELPIGNIFGITTFELG